MRDGGAVERSIIDSSSGSLRELADDMEWLRRILGSSLVCKSVSARMRRDRCGKPRFGESKIDWPCAEHDSRFLG